MRWPSCCARIAPPCASRAFRLALDVESPAWVASIVPPAKISDTTCDCGRDGSEKKLMRGSRSVPRTFTPAFTSGNSLVARMSTPGSLMSPPEKMSLPRSISRRRPSAAYFPSTTPSSPLPRLTPSGVLRTLMLPATRPLRPNESTVTRSPSVSLISLDTRNELAGSTGSAPTMISSVEVETAPVRSTGVRRALGTSTVPVASKSRPVTLNSRFGVAVMRASGRSMIGISAP